MTNSSSSESSGVVVEGDVVVVFVVKDDADVLGEVGVVLAVVVDI